jgi:hypothetical protein
MTTERAIQLIREAHPEAADIREWDGGLRVLIRFDGEQEVRCDLFLPHHSAPNLQRWLRNVLPGLRPTYASVPPTLR